MIDFEIPDDLAALRDEIRAFVVDTIVAFRARTRASPGTGPNEELRSELVGLGARRRSC